MAKAKVNYINVIRQEGKDIDGRRKTMTEKAYGMIGSVLKFGKKWEHGGWVKDEGQFGKAPEKPAVSAAAKAVAAAAAGGDSAADQAKADAKATADAQRLIASKKELNKLKAAATRAENKQESTPSDENAEDAINKRALADEAAKSHEQLKAEIGA